MLTALVLEVIFEDIPLRTRFKVRLSELQGTPGMRRRAFEPRGAFTCNFPVAVVYRPRNPTSQGCP